MEKQTKKGTFLLNNEYYRYCGKCKSAKKLTEENFHRDKSRPLGFMFECKACCVDRKDLRKNRWLKMTEAQKETKRQAANRYKKTLIGRAIHKINSYRKYDKKKGFTCDLDKEFMYEHIFPKPCIYCGKEGASGCDRIDNKKGHTKDNVVPCCHECNVCRMDRFTHEEMLIIGQTVKVIMANRKWKDTL